MSNQRSSLPSLDFIIRRDAATTFSGSYEYCIVFPVEKDGSQSDYSKHAIKRMLESGLEIFPYLSVQKDELLVLFRAPVSRGNPSLELSPPSSISPAHTL